MLRTGLIPFLLACLIYFFVGNGQGAQAADIDLTKLFSQEYILSAWTLIPAIVLLTMVMLKADIKLTMIASIASAFVTALFLRDLGKLCKIRNFSQSPFGGFISEESDGNFPSGRN